MKKLLFVLVVSLLPLMAMAQSDFSERTGKGFIGLVVTLLFPGSPDI